jgi:four helix bundle protein
MQARIHGLAMGTVAFVRTLSDSAEGREWGSQLRRASTGASAAYRASRRGKSKRDWLDKIADCVEELDECDHWFAVIDESALSVVPKNLRSEVTELRAILARSLATGKANERRNKRSSRRPA